jgi:hypothetical protein
MDGKALAEFVLKIRAAVIEECAKAVESKVADHEETFRAPLHEQNRLLFALDGRVFAAAIRALKEREAQG